MKSKISCWRFVRSLPMSMRFAVSSVLSNVCSHTVSPPADGLKCAGLYSPRPRADGGIGRRARLRAWSGITGWRFESSSAHHLCLVGTKAPKMGALVVFDLFRFQRCLVQPPADFRPSRSGQQVTYDVRGLA